MVVAWTKPLKEGRIFTLFRVTKPWGTSVGQPKRQQSQEVDDKRHDQTGTNPRCDISSEGLITDPLTKPALWLGGLRGIDAVPHPVDAVLCGRDLRLEIFFHVPKLLPIAVTHWD